jgi:hypothetical protein
LGPLEERLRFVVTRPQAVQVETTVGARGDLEVWVPDRIDRHVQLLSAQVGDAPASLGGGEARDVGRLDPTGLHGDDAVEPVMLLPDHGDLDPEQLSDEPQRGVA